MRTVASIQWLNDLRSDERTAQASGGKASGLHQLMRWGLNVPDGFVIINAQRGQYPEQLADCYRQLGAGKVAVRSSALGEDGKDSSFAGQYDSVLNVQGLAQLRAAIDRCIDSLHSQRATTYQEQHHLNGAQMNVIVQNMVDARAAGVMFTVDPVSGRHDRQVIDAVAGLGEALVSGEATPDHYEFDQDGQLVSSELVNDAAILSTEQCEQLVQEARAALRQAGEPLDLEWAIDQQGRLFWLQARPITTIGADLNELDTPITPDDVLTRCNVGEMMPGAACPLTFSTTGRSIENGMQHMHVSYAGRPGVNQEWTQIAMSHGKLFINLSGSAAAASAVLGVNAKSLGYSVCGDVVEGLQDPPRRPWWMRLWGTIKLLNYLQAADEVIAAFKQRAQHFSVPTSGSSQVIATALDNALPFYSEAMEVHLRSSTTSGMATNVLQAMISGGQESTPAEQAEAANLMAGAAEVESALLVEHLDGIIDRIAADTSSANDFVRWETADALRWLNTAGGAITIEFQRFLQRHGHRGYRELCMREPSWADAPERLVETIQASVNARLSGTFACDRPAVADQDKLSARMRWILPKAHNAIRRREATKSLLVDIANRFKQSYRALGEQLLAEGKLDDADQVFFFTHQELMDFVKRNVAGDIDLAYWQHKTKQRRIALECQNRLEFNEICVGKPAPIDTRSMSANLADGIVGRPVSAGMVEANARVAFSVDEAAALQPGEILVAPITDVGWTPYFSVISGLITDVGSAVSHGAVIAREYGLPAIVNTRVATRRIKTGDKIQLDANTGMVTLL